MPEGVLDDLESRITNHEALVGVIGLGYVGLPISCTIAERGLRAIGVDVDPAKVERLRSGKSYLRHVPDDRIAALVDPGRGAEELARGREAGFVPTADFDHLALCDAILICVPTPLSPAREPDLSFVVDTVETVAAKLRPGQLVVLESTSYPGTTDEVVKPILERSGLRTGKDFALAFSPEREDPGNAAFATSAIPKLVGGVTERCGKIAVALYETFIDRVVPVSTAKVAESAKILENVFRAVNIALVNEAKLLFERMDVDVWEVIEAAATKPFGFMPFQPGPGLGGHCIPVDPFYLTWKARHFDFATRFIELAGEINSAMPEHVVERIALALNDRERSVRGARILILGIAYKKDVDDLRESPALRILEILEARGARVAYNDPHVPTLRARKLRHYEPIELDSTPLTPEALGEADAVVIATDHAAYDWDEVVERSRLVVDTRNATRGVRQGREKIVKA
jgi:UDP-N-acetyl-D-glucosamine dehydrogenase